MCRQARLHLEIQPGQDRRQKNKYAAHPGLPGHSTWAYLRPDHSFKPMPFRGAGLIQASGHLLHDAQRDTFGI